MLEAINKMLEVIKSDEICTSCGNRQCKTRKIKINRRGGAKPGENIMSISLCDECFLGLINEFRSYEAEIEIEPKIEVNFEYDTELVEKVLRE